MSKQMWTEMLMRVGTCDEANAFIEISPDGDGLGCVRLHCPTKNGKEWFGEFDFTLNPEAARAVAKAMIAVANAIEADK